MSQLDRQLLKQCRTYILDEEWEKAQAKAFVRILTSVPRSSSLTPTTIMRLALLHLGRQAESEASYTKATKLQPEQLLAWQGLDKLFESQQQCAKLADVLEQMATVHAHASDADKCAATLARLLRITREHSTRAEYYDLLSTLPAPDPTTSSASPAYPVQLIMHTEKVPHAVELMKLCEEQDEEDIESTFQKQKGTLEAVKMGISVFKGHVAAKVLISSPVWSVYQYILAYAQDDTLRRDVEAKELRYYYRITVSLPPSGPHARKEHQEHTRAKTLELARGMVTLGVPDELAWRVFLEWTDAPLARLPYDELRRYVQLFPSAGRAYAFRALLRLVKDQAYLQDCTEAGPERVAEEHDLLQLALDGYEKMKDSTLCARILSLFYLLDRDYTSALDVLLHAHARQRALSTSTGVDTPRVNAEVAAQLATLYAHLHAPKHHAEAWQLATEVLEHQPHQIDALLVKAYVQEARREWKAARQGFQQVMSQPLGASTSYGRNLSALYLSADYHLEAEAAYTRTLVEMGEYEDARHALDSLLERCDHESNVFGAEFRARLWYERGRCLWSLGGEYRTAPEHAYQCFIESIKRFATYAPAFTALGEYYETAVSPPDMVRASKCYQRAFELDATEYEAGRHLVEHFAAQREWGLVDVIARRVAEAEGGAEVLSGQATTAHVTSNAWVWKAIGIVEAQNQHADAAIAAFQVALRASPRDADLWTRLGEAYVASGRPIAALKTYKRALSLQPPSDDAWHLYYDMAEVHRRLGRYEVALELLERVQVMAPPSQHGVRVVLAETRLAHARFLLGGGHIHRALLALHQAIDDAAKTLHADALLSTAWKVVADACFLLAKMDVALPRDDDAAESTPASLAATLESLVLLLDQQDVDNRLAAVSVVKASDLASADLSSRSWQAQEYLEHAAAVYKYLAVLQGQNAAAGVWAWADLATALCRLSWLWSSPAVLARAAAQGEDEDALSLRAQQARLQALECTQLALQLKPQARLWLLQGNLHFGKNMVLAQHAYIMAIEANPKSPVPWTNLGFLYLDVNDLALAEEAFVRAQTMAPDWPASWLGAALVHERHGAKPRSYARLWEQACVLSDGALLEADYGFALAVWDHAHGGGHVPRVRMLAPLLALQRYLAQRPQDDAALHLSALVAEQQGGAAMAVHRIERASAVLEAEYEATESSVTAMHYGLASMNLARIRLANTDAAGAMEAVESALALMEDEESVSSITARAWCTLYQGQAQFMAGEREAGVEALRTLLLSLPDVEMDDGQRRALHACAAVWLARMLWTQGASMADMEHVLDTAYDGLLITTRAALCSAVGETDKYNQVLAKHVASLPPALQTSLRNAPKTALLSVLHLASVFDMPTMLQFLARTYTRDDRTPEMMVLVARTLVRLAAGCYRKNATLPSLPLAEGQGDGSLLAVTRHVLHTVEHSAEEHGAHHWADAHAAVALAEYLAVSGRVDVPPAPARDDQPVISEGDEAPGVPAVPAAPAPPSRDAAVRHAAHAVHLAPWCTSHWQTLRATQA